MYQPDKFKVHLGKGDHIGFCTFWNEPEKAIALAPELLEKCAIIGTLYSRQGVNIILRNLALNPHIRVVFAWGYGELSQTKFGTAGRDILFALWERGVNDDGSIPNTNFLLEKELDVTVVRDIIKHVQLVDISEVPLDKVLTQLQVQESDVYMEPVRFADAIPTAVERFQSENVGWLARGKKVIDVWTRVVQRVMLYGAIKGTQYGSKQKELMGFSWVIDDEDPDNPVLPDEWPQDLREVTGATQDAIEQYFKVFLSKEMPAGVQYTYGNRLMCWGPNCLDQITDSIERNFTLSPDTRRAVMTTLIPSIDALSSEPPCLTQVQFLQTDGKLHMLSTFRSHDIFKAAIPNAFGLRKLQKEVSKRLGFDMGALHIVSNSAHLYEADWANAKKLIACAFTERDPSLVFDAETEGDPRGNARIEVANGKIHVTVMGVDGIELIQLGGASAHEVVRKLGQMDLFADATHMLYIGTELEKADFALKNGLAYTQDKPLDLNKKATYEKSSEKSICESSEGSGLC